jgi:cytochrome c oxidase subunit 3
MVGEKVASQGIGHHEVDLSVWPIVVGLSTLVLLLGLMALFQWKVVMGGLVAAGAGLVGVLIGLFGWVSEIYGRKMDVGLSKVAIGIFIISEFFLFGALFGSYFYAMFPAEVWPPAGTPAGVPPLSIAMLLSVFLLSSSATIHAAESRLEKSNIAGFKGWLFFTMILGVVFITGQAMEWSKLIGEGFTINSNAFGRFFYLITGFHGAHVVVGLLIQLFVLMMANKLTAQKHTIAKACGYYWHFVDGIWLLVLSLVYILPAAKG